MPPFDNVNLRVDMEKFVKRAQLDMTILDDQALVAVASQIGLAIDRVPDPDIGGERYTALTAAWENACEIYRQSGHTDDERAGAIYCPVNY